MGTSSHRPVVSESNRINRIVVLGSGNVAGHIAKALDKVADVVQVFSRTEKNARQLSAQLKNASATSNINSIVTDADLYLMALKDDVIAETVKHSPETTGIWVHTSGSVPASVFEGIKESYGVFYPLQTFNKVTDLDVSKVPILIEGNSKATFESLFELACRISKKVEAADSDKRKLLHRAAVFACNFANYMWCISDDILKEGGYDLSILEPLLRMTLDNALKSGARASQTGPARRGDFNIIEEHASLLPEQYAGLYRMISEKINDDFNQRGE